MNQISTLSTFVLFGRTAMRRLINHSASMKFPSLKKKAAGTTDAPARTATRHRSDRVSLLRRLAGMWLPIFSLLGVVGLSFNTIFVILDSVQLDESRTAAVLQVSPENFEHLQKAVAIADKDERTTAVEDALRTAFSSPATWQTNANRHLAKERLDQKGLAAFAPFTTDSEWRGTMAYLSPDGRSKAMQAVGIYLAFLNIAISCVVFGVMSKHLSGLDPTLAWLWQFPVSRRVLFSSKLIEYMFDNVTAPVTAIFYATAMWLCGASFLQGLRTGALLGISAGISSAALRLAAETFVTQRLGRRTRGAIVACLSAAGSLSLLVCMIGSNSQFLIEWFIKAANLLPAWLSWNPYTGGLGTDAMMNQSAAWWLIAPAIAALLALVAVLVAVRLTASGLACAQDSVRGSRPSIARAPSRRMRFGIIAWKELLQMRRQPEFAGQVLATPLGIGFLLYIAGYQNIMDLAIKGGTNISMTILVGCSYMLMVAATQMLSSEFKTLWLLQTQPRPLADVVRSKARVWAVIAISLSLPFIGGAIAVFPSAAASILVHVPFLFVALWLLSELVFGLTALSAIINNEQTVRFRRSSMLPMLVVSDASLAIYSQSWWMQFGSLVTLVILNVAVRQRQLAELSWLSEPVESPPKQVYPMHAILAVVAFQALMGIISAALLQRPELSASAIAAISYIGSAIIVSLLCWVWMSEKRLTVLPTVPRGPVLRPIFWGLSLSCAAGLAVTLVICRWFLDGQLPAYASSGSLRHTLYDKWWLLGLWVVAAPLFEEWIIRGMLYRSLRRTWGIGLSVAVSAILFATLHPAAGCIALVTLGTMTALAVEKTGRLWPAITIHAGYNFMIWALWAA